MNFRMKQKCLCTFFISIVLVSHFAPAISMSVQQSTQLEQANSNSRAYNVKSNNVKKTQMLESKQDIPQTNGEFSWTKIISLGLQLVLSFFGNDNVAIEKMDPGSPVEAFLTAIIAYFTGSNDPNEVKVMAKQATELWDIVISLLDTLRTSFSQRSFDARAIGSNDLVADAAVASTSMVKSFIKTYNTNDDMCIQKYVCEANRECSDETSETGYLFCQIGSYALSYALEGKSYTPFEIVSDAARMGRIGEDCTVLFKECKDNYF